MAKFLAIVVLAKDRLLGAERFLFSRKRGSAFTKAEIIGGVIAGAALAVASFFQQLGISSGTDAGKASFITALYVVIVPIYALILKKRAPLLANKTGGFSGPAIKPVAVRMVYQVYDAVKIPIVGMGGISTAEDVIEFMMAGASAVEVGAENLVNPFACRDIINALPAAMEKYRIESLSEIIGAAHKQVI